MVVLDFCGCVVSWRGEVGYHLQGKEVWKEKLRMWVSRQQVEMED